MKKPGKIDRKNIENILALTPMQEGMLFHYLKAPESDHYFEHLSLVISGEINEVLFEKAWNFVIDTNEMLRTVFRWEQIEHPVQINLKKHKFKPVFLETIAEKDRRKKFDLRGQDVPFRVSLRKLENHKYEMIIDNHHILYDGWCSGIILKEFFEAYGSLANGKKPVRPPKTKFKEFIKWQRNQDIEKQKTYWRNYLKGFYTQTALPVKRDRKGAEGAETFRLSVPKGIKDKSAGFVKKHKITLASLLYSTWGLLLQKYNNTDDVIFGTTVSGRSAKIQGIEDMVGVFINTIPLRFQAAPGEKLNAVLNKIDKEVQGREVYEHTSLVDIKACSDIDNQEELFNSIVIIENYPLDSRLVSGSNNVSVDSYSVIEKTHYDLTVVIMLFDGIEIDFTYSSSLFEKAAIRHLSRHFQVIIDSILKNPGQETGNLEIVSPEEKNKLLYQFNDTGTDYPRDKTVHQLFEDQVVRTPDHIVLIGPIGSISPMNSTSSPSASGGWGALTYSDLNRGADGLTYLLKKKGIVAGTIVGLMLERSLEMIVAMLGILKSGGVYLPIAPDYPEARINYMLADSNAKMVVTADTLPAARPFLNLAARSPQSAAGFSPLAYAIYTSGSTGRPKGVLIEHRSLVNFFKGITDIIPFKTHDRILSLTTVTFDIFGLETLLPFTKGSRVIIGRREEQLSTTAAAGLIRKEKVTIFQLTPSRLQLFLPGKAAADGLALLKHLLVGGEPFPGSLLEKVRKITTAKIYNLYGPTETTIWSTVKDLTGKEPLNIGKPIANTRIYILGSTGTLQPVGVLGELFIAGDGLSRGYLNRPELTAERFNRSYKSYRTYISYKTGDLARWLPDGSIEFAGRVDHQVKIRGFRIELGEIENRLSEHQTIKEAVVIVREDQNGQHFLCGYIISPQEPDISQLKQYLAEKLPGYMIPSYFLRLEKFPLTPSGKVDRKSLPDVGRSRAAVESAYTPPKNEIEKVIADTWQDVLCLDRVGIDDNFFDLGGHSLYLLRVNSKLQEALKKEIPVVALFNYPTVRTLAGYLSREESREAFRKNKKPVNRPGIKSKGIAVIGMACRFPGAKNYNEFWNNLKNGVESIVFLTPGELIQSGVAAGLANDPDYVAAKGILEDKSHFDSSFFDYTPAEAEIMDPQMRIFHECCWEALEDAAYDSEAYDGLIGLYAGASPNPYWAVWPLLPGTDGHSYSFAEKWGAIQFSDREYLSTRIAYKFDLKGPAVTVQTACSTSLAAIDLACRGLLSGACDMALAGGVSITLYDETGYLHQEGMIMSADGHCRAFDAGANGTIGGNGAGVVVLKRLEDALEDRDNIYAVIKGTAVNNDGIQKVGFTAPGIAGQAAVIRAALQMAGVEPESITYIECHGTGTPLGDPIEIEALKQVFDPDKKQVCCIGSVKTNIGHLDAAAGAAGFIKTVLALRHRLIPPSLHFQVPNPKTDLENSPFYVNTAPTPWKSHKSPLRAGVTSLGIGGTNAHVVLEEGPGDIARKTEEREHRLMVLSAKTPSALDKMTANMVNYLKDNLIGPIGPIGPINLKLADVAYTLQVGRRPFKYRKMLVCNNVNEAVETLSSPRSPKIRTAAAVKRQKVVFMFPGQGVQYVNMGLGLYRTQPLFRREMDRCFEILAPFMKENIKEIIYPSTGAGKSLSKKITQTETAQPVLFIFEYALAKLLMEWGVIPAVMIGHSIGEYTAACLSGVLSLEDALKVVTLRGKLMQQIPPGSMLSVPLPEGEVLPLMPPGLSLAAVNSSSDCVVSGPHEGVEAFKKELKEKGHQTRDLHTSHAFHSGMMDPVLKEFEGHLAGVSVNPPEIPYLSNVSGSHVTHRQVSTPRYWGTHLRRTVRFAHGLEELLKMENVTLVEVGPGKTLSTFARRHSHKKPGHIAVDLIRHPKENTSDHIFLLDRVGRLWLSGVTVDWRAFYGKERHRRVSLPTYPFEGKVYPIDADPLKISRRLSAGDPRPGKKKDIADWFYIPMWEPTLLNGREHREAPPGTWWVVFMDACGVGDRLVQRLQAKGRKVIRVIPGKTFTAAGRDTFIIDPRQADQYDHLFHHIYSHHGGVHAVLHLWSVTGSPGNGHGTPGIPETEGLMQTGYYSLLYIVQALGKQGLPHPVHLEVVSDSMQHVTGEEIVSPAKAAVLGPVTVIPREYPDIHCRSIDIILPDLHDPQDLEKAKPVNQLWQEIETGSDEPVIAYRGPHRLVQTVKPVRLDNPVGTPTRLREKGVYLVTGGLGGIGLVVAEHLARTAKAKLILTDRIPFPARDEWEAWLTSHDGDNIYSRKIQKLKELEKSGAEAAVFSVDVSDAGQMKPVITRAEARFGRINGIIHTAGLADGTLIREHTGEKSEEVFAPKVKGTLVLDSLLEQPGPDFVVLFSSVNTVVPAVGQVAYGAANAFLNAFAHCKNAAGGGFTVSINWDAWEDVGMAAAAAGQLKGKIKDGILSRQGTDALNRILDLEVPQMFVSPKNLKEILVQVTSTGAPGLEEEFMETTVSRGVHQRPELATPYVVPGSPTEHALARIWQTHFGIDPVGIHDDFFELGGDSLKAVTIAAAVNRELDVGVPVSEFFNSPTIAKLAQYLTRSPGRATGDVYDSIEPLAEQPFYDLSFSQKRLWFIELRESGGSAFNMPVKTVLYEAVDETAVKDAIKKLIARHESFRTSFKEVDNNPVQVIESAAGFDFALETLDISHLDETACNRERDRLLLEESTRVFDLRKVPLFRVKLVKCRAQEFDLIFNMHHIISDGWSMEILKQEFTRLYNARKKGEPHELKPLEIQYKDYAAWQNRLLADEERIGKAKEFWKNQFSGSFPVMNLPYDVLPSASFDKESAAYRQVIPRDLSNRLRQLARDRHASLFMVLLVGFNLLLSRVTGQTDTVIAIPAAARQHDVLKNIVGMFVNTLILRTTVDSSETFDAFFKRLQDNTFHVLEYQGFPLELICSELKIKYPKVSVFFNMVNLGDTPGETLGDVENRRIEKVQDTKFDILCYLTEYKNGIVIECHYYRALFEPETIEKMMGMYSEILGNICGSPGKTVGEYSQSGKRRILKRKN